MFRFTLCSAMILSAALTAFARAGEADRLDWSAWQHIPVLHEGRVMPLDTFARKAVDIICDRTRPKLGLNGAVSSDELDSSDYDLARELFPARGQLKLGDPRTFGPAELLLSWLTEPEKWEEVPFILAEHDALRKDYLEVPVTNDKGEHLRYVSPRQVREAVAFHEALEQISVRRQQARLKGQEFEPTSLDTKITDVNDAYTLYRSLTFNPSRLMSFPLMEELRAESQFLRKFNAALKTWSSLRDGQQRLLDLLPDLPKFAAQADQAAQDLGELIDQPDVPREQAEPAVLKLIEAAEGLNAVLSNIRQKLNEAPPERLDEEHVKSLQTIMRQLDLQSAQLVKQVREMHVALYDNGNALRVVQALNPYALERDRPREDDAQPWHSLQTVLYGSPLLLADYPTATLATARESFGKMVSAYHDWRKDSTSGNAQRFAAAERQFAGALRDLGETIEPLRQKLPIESKDEDLIRYTAYPPAGATDMEVRYNHIEPFMYSWMISLAAAISFSLAFGVLRKPMFWCGMLLLVAGLGWTAYGFAMRVVITKWAPVTNMYETVVYVPFFVSLLGAWFTMLPFTWPGVKNSWRLTAIPGTWEGKELSAEHETVLDRSTWTLAGYLLIPVRAGLMALVFYVLAKAPYAAGERTIINLTPNIDVGQSLPDGNDLMTWAVGLFVLVPAVWYLPRAAMSLVLSLGLVPASARGRSRELLAQVYPRWPFALGATLAAFGGAFVAWWSPLLDESIGPLQPVLRDNFWLTIHVLTIVSSYGAGLLAWSLGLIALVFYLFGRYRDPAPHAGRPEGHRPTSGDAIDAVFAGRRPPEACATLAGYIYKAMQVAVLLLVAGTILGGLWADVSWGRFWGWDPKEVWALISALVYIAILHGRFAGWFGNFGLAAGSVLGASAIAFSWYGVNFVLGAGLHSYGFGAGGQAEVGLFVLSNWILLGAAAVRYFAETRLVEVAVPAEAEAVEAEVVEAGSRAPG